MSELEKMMSGQCFDGSDDEISRLRESALNAMTGFNAGPAELRNSHLQQLLGRIGEGSIINPPFHCEFGQTISVGHHTFINMNVTMLDGAAITIGNHVLIGPNTQLYTPSHSMDYQSRRRWETFCRPIVIEDDVWIGGNVVINQGVTIGARSVIAAGSVVNSDVPSDCLYGGTPAKLIRKLEQ